MNRTTRLIAALAVGALPLAGLVAAPQAGATEEPLTATFDADPTTFGTIDGPGGCDAASEPLDVAIPVEGMSGDLDDLRVSITMAQTWVGDVNASLIGPDGTTAEIFGETRLEGASGCGDASDLNGTYVFADDGTDNIPNSANLNAVIPTEPVYRTTPFGPHLAYDSVEPTLLTPAFAGLADLNGTWILRFTDTGGADPLTVSGASLTISTVPTAACEAAKADVPKKQAALDKAKKAKKKAQKKARKAKKAFKKAKKNDAPKKTIKKKRSKKNKAVKQLKKKSKTVKKANKRLKTAQTRKSTACA